MRLTHLKLAGFKSFVDPATIPVPGQLVAVVGPNGCGKSNVIDAVRWVLGESSARQLRGESMQDVIFNGSNTRKPVSRASVELVFDNSAGRAGGPWGAYAEISVQRMLDRQGTSSYLINKQPVRRRDITDLFLGTGVGTRGYAVIEQGMISRIIEARPEELRAYLEEAAGVSKYKERRHETERRMADTRENLTRLDDIAQENIRQLEKLEEQAAVAAQFQGLKGEIEERQNLLALQRRQDAERNATRARQEYDTARNRLEEETARLRETEARIEVQRGAHYEQTDALAEAQSALAEANTAVARLEARLQHLRDTRQRLNQTMRQIKEQQSGLETQGREQRHEAGAWQDKQREAEAALIAAQVTLEQEQAAIPQLENSWREADARWQAQREQIGQTQAEVQLTAQRIQHLQERAAEQRQRAEKLEAEAEASGQPDAAALIAQQGALEEAVLALESASLRIEQLERELHEQEAARDALRHQRDLLRQQHTECSARRNALHSLRDAVGGEQKLETWLHVRGLHDTPRLFECLTVEPGWENAVEAVLRERVRARLWPSAHPLPASGDWPEVGATFLLAATAPGTTVASETVGPDRSTQQTSAQVAAISALPVPTWTVTAFPLLDKVRSSDPAIMRVLADWLAQVWCAADEEASLALQPHLPPGGLAITAAGHAVSRHAIHRHGSGDAGSGALHRTRTLAELEQRLTELEPRLQTLEAQSADAEQKIQWTGNTLKGERLKLDQMRAAHSAQALRCAQAQQAAEQAHEAARARAAVQEEILQELARIETHLVSGQAQQRAQVEDTDTRQSQLEALAHIRQASEAAYSTQRDRAHGAERAVQEARFTVQGAQARLEEIVRRDTSHHEQMTRITAQLEDLRFQLEALDEEDFDIEFQAALDLRGRCEQALSQIRDASNQATNRLKELELERQLLEKSFDPLREVITQWQLKEQAALQECARYTEELEAAQANIEALLPKLGKGLKIGALVEEIGTLLQQQKTLGNVNLAALEELETARERKNYLDAQSQDLQAALATLEDAIRKIDQESRELLRNTFEQVNASLQQLFPALFGGGHAELVLTGEEILDAGIQIMAQPPGKKNATIHLLSGGEKALTALSLVFSLFQLNPAPFCLLDEVDAPLDDANTGRFCQMVQRMAEKTQFLYISHNKITMEMANQLIGITMQEQGVSRVVAVDIEAALRMSEKTGGNEKPGGSEKSSALLHS